MNRLFWGLLFCLLDIEITVGSAVFGLLPDFAGYFLLMKGMEELAGESGHFDKWRHVAFGMTILSVILYAADLMDLTSMSAVGVWVLELVGVAVGIVLVGRIVAGIRQMELQRGWELGGERLKALWLILAVMHPLCCLLNWVPLVGTICNVAGAVTGVLFLLPFAATRKAFYAYVK